MRSHERQVAALAADLGLQVRHTRRGHLHLVDAAGRLIAVVSCTPSCPEQALRQVGREARRRLAQQDGR
jgi:hypothetical protein